MNEDLTYEEQYNVPVNIILTDFTAEYYRCGSHQLAVSGETELEHLQELYDYLKTVRGIKL